MCRQIRRLAIIDRGLPAARLLSAVSELNLADDQPTISTVVLHTDVDAAAWFVGEADEAFPLGPAIPEPDGAGGVLDVTAALAALQRAGADAVWVDWQLLADPGSFVRRCEEAGILVLGPPSTTIERLGGVATSTMDRLGEVVASGGDGGGEPMESPTRVIVVPALVDDDATVWTVGFIDSTLRRGGQPVIEESVTLPPGVARAVRATVAGLMEELGHRGAAAVEFAINLPTSQWRLHEVQVRLPFAHLVTEMTTGLDLVKLRVQVARGDRLLGAPPATCGHAIQVHLRAQDPQNDFAPAPGRVVRLARPAGIGIRVEAAVREGDQIHAGGDLTVATIAAYGRDRSEALARLRRALRQTAVVIEGGTTDRSFLLALLDHPEVRHGGVDDGWLDRFVAGGGHLPAPDPVALTLAAVGCYRLDQAADQAAFHARAARGAPPHATEPGYRSQLGYRGHRYDLRVLRTGARTYRVSGEAGIADVTLASAGRYEQTVVVGDRAHRVQAAIDGPCLRVDVDGAAHVVSRDDGATVRCPGPAFVVSVAVAVGDLVRAGDPLAVVESMKLESTIAAPFAGEVVAVEVAENTQVDAGAPVVRIRAAHIGSAPAGDRVRLSGLVSTPPHTPPCEQVYGALQSYLLGYDLDPATVRELLTRQRRLGELAPPADADLLSCEDGLLDVFADACALSRPRNGAEAEAGDGTQEYLLSYLQWLDADRAGLPDGYRRRLERALLRYGVRRLDRTAELEEAVVWMFRSVQRVAELVPAITNILLRRLRWHGVLADRADDAMRARLDRLAAAVSGRHQAVADLVRDNRFRYVDEPLLAAVTAEEQARAERDLEAASRDPDRARTRERINRLVSCPQPLRPLLLRHWLDSTDARTRRILLEVYTRRFYRIRRLQRLRFVRPAGWQLATAEYDLGEKRIHLVTSYAPLDELPALSQAIAAHVRAAGTDRAVVVDVATWRSGDLVDIDTLAAEVEKLLASCEFDRPLWRLDVTVTTLDGPEPERLRTQHLTFRAGEDGTFVEEPLYRNLHPMLAKRLELWRLSNFELRRVRSAEDVYVFHGVARDNPSDHRLFALAEVRDLTATPDADGRVRYPRMELLGLLALAAMREALSTFGERDRPAANRIVLYVRPPWDLPAARWPELARSLAPLAAGAGLEKVVLRVQIPHDGGGRDAVLQVEGLDGGVIVRERRPGDEPVRSLSPYQQKLLRAQRLGAPYPYEIVRMLTPPPGAPARFPAGRFTEYDLDPDGVLVPVARGYGLNTANIVVGVLTNDTASVPEGMARVAIFGDPTTGLGNLAEQECRRIIAALDLAERMRLPVEWFALSSGARIAMDSGTENMDWIAAVLRRIIEFTQAGGEVNIIVTGVNVGAQPYWNAEATMLMHTRGILVMTPASAMVLTGKQALDFSGGVSADDNFGIGGYDQIMGPNGQGQYWAGSLVAACDILLRHYEHTYVVPGEPRPRRRTTPDPIERDVRAAPHFEPGTELRSVGDVFSTEHNADRKRPFDMRAVMRALTDADCDPLERWANWRGGETAIVWDAHVGGIPVSLLGIESHTVARHGFVPAGGPGSWTSGTLFPQSSRKLARAINAATGNRPVVVLANLSGFDGSPESMRRWQLEYGAEIGRAVVNFRGPIVFVVVSRYHGGAFVVFSTTLNEHLEIAAVAGSFASVIGGAPAAATVFAREVKTRTDADPLVREATERLRAASDAAAGVARAQLAETLATVRSQKLGEVADEFDRVHTVQRALAVGSVDRIINGGELRPYIVDALERGLAASPG